jgi:hypothetical protein
MDTTKQPNNIIDDQINEAIQRIDIVLERNIKIFWLVIVMSVFIFAVGTVLMVIGMQSNDWRLLVPSAFITGLLYWPINKIISIRKENIQLAVVPALIRMLPADKAAEQIIKLIENLKP